MNEMFPVRLLFFFYSMLLLLLLPLPLLVLQVAIAAAAGRAALLLPSLLWTIFGVWKMHGFLLCSLLAQADNSTPTWMGLGTTNYELRTTNPHIHILIHMAPNAIWAASYTLLFRLPLCTSRMHFAFLFIMFICCHLSHNNFKPRPPRRT